MKILAVATLTLVSLSVSAQNIIGRWQLMKQSSCLESQLDDPNQSEDMDQLLADRNSMNKRTADVIEFKAKMKAEQSTTILGKKKDANEKSFLYRFDGSSLHMLDKKSRTIIASYTVEKFTANSLILADAARPCEVRVFERIE